MSGERAGFGGRWTAVVQRAGTRRIGLAVGVLVLAALIVRLDGIATPLTESRELHNALVARELYLGEGEGLPPAKQRVLHELRDVVRPIEPPVLDVVAAAGFRLAGGEELWIPRLVVTLVWLAGGGFLFLLARRITTPFGALVALALYLFWPYAAWISRLYMPDALMIALLLAALLGIVRYWERRSPGRFVAAGLLAGLATVAKPGIAFLFVLGVFLALAASRRALRDTLLRGSGALFAAAALAPALVYFVVGTSTGLLADESGGRIEPSLVATAWFWNGWWEMVAIALAYPQQQHWLAVAPLVAALAGVAAARRGHGRAVLVGLGLAYVAYALTFTNHVPSHPYYSLPLVVFLSLALGALAGRLLEWARARGGSLAIAIPVLAALVVAGMAYKAHAVVTAPSPAERIADYQRVGRVTGHTTRAVYVDVKLRSPISYWGWMVGRYWYPPTPSIDLPAEGDPFPAWIDISTSDYLIVMEMSELEQEPTLRRFVRDLPVVERTSRWVVYDLRTLRTR